MNGPHFFVAPEDHDTSRGVLRGEQAHHVARVLRVGPGEPLSIADGTGAVYQAHVAAVDGEVVSYRLAERVDVAPARPALAVVHALPKGRKLDGVIQRLTELGVDRIAPVHSERSQVRLDVPKAKKAHKRWEAVALAAAKQSRRARLPVIEPVGEWQAAFPGRGAGAVLNVGAATRLRDCIDVDGDAVVLAVGPEGGLTDEEVTGCGLCPASLGPTVLRTETAALVACAAVLTLTGRIG